ncbi:MAG: penicillin-binding protein 1C [Planctomycetota bacterium]
MKSVLGRTTKRLAPAFLLLIVLVAAGFGVLWHVVSIPLQRLERWPKSALVTDREGGVLLEVVGADDQLRRPVPLEEMSPWLVKATLVLEDERFFLHHGVDPASVLRALWQNVRAGRVVSGASTLTMQVCKMLGNRPRTWRAKLIESVQALQLERCLEKNEILELYLNIAPYGGNLRGVEAAAQRYFGKRAKDLSLGEAALLAALPKAPSRYRPDRFPEAARERRDLALRRLASAGLVAAELARQVLSEPVQVKMSRPEALGFHASRLALERRPEGGRTTIAASAQREAERLVSEHAATLPDGTDIAAVVIEIGSGDIVALVGSADASDPSDGEVNGAVSRRSPGSALKPFVYAAAFETRRLSPDAIVYDVPIQRSGWEPSNFEEGFAGELSAAEALRRSLNVPAILVAEGVGLAYCAGIIEAAGVHLPDLVAAESGLATVIGATEVTLLDLVNGYATLGRGGVRQRARLFLDEPQEPARVLSESACAAIEQILSSHVRRPSGMAELAADEVPWFMWKTGTSSGRRDAWAVGHNRRYAAGVWVGRFSGAGHVAYVGRTVAEPLLARIFSLPELRSEECPLPPEPWEVRHPLPSPHGAAAPLAILEPEDGATYLAVSGRAVLLRPRASRDGAFDWFLDGLLLEAAGDLRLELLPGTHELRCVDASGRAGVSRFVVRSAL